VDIRTITNPNSNSNQTVSGRFWVAAKRYPAPMTRRRDVFDWRCCSMYSETTGSVRHTLRTGQYQTYKWTSPQVSVKETGSVNTAGRSSQPWWCGAMSPDTRLSDTGGMMATDSLLSRALAELSSLSTTTARSQWTWNWRQDFLLESTVTSRVELSLQTAWTVLAAL